ncbi:MAG: prepilin-type N-terminal cleavage/methylation domain-containing protein [Pseudomonadota bacterium]|nr:prepilin-type N-terminal cleavage/methylation domain-containing protein [Pseudomonadota bacterium]
MTPRRRLRAARGNHLRRNPQRGYTLIEVIVAFSLMALALTLLLGTLSGATRQVRWAGDAGRATLHAQSLLDQVGTVVPIEPGRRSGDFDDGRYRWTLQVSPWADPETQQDPLQTVGGTGLYEVALAVEWGDGRRGQQVQLRTLRLVQGGPRAVLP